jgi:molybdenum cofactor synthesis domain-containing protein
VATRVGIVILGDEVLKGEVREANLAYMLPLLNEWGAETVLCAILPDRIPDVVRHLRAYLEEADFLILTGGIGPTPDDITREAVAEVAGVPLVLDEEAKAALESHPFHGGDPRYRMRMAHVPRGATLIPNPLSGAPGFHIHRMAVFPGIPLLLQAMFHWVKPRVAGNRKTRITLYSLAPESSFAGIMEESMRLFPDVGIGSYPITGAETGYRVRVIFRGDGYARTADCAAGFREKLARAGYEILRAEEERGDNA